MKCATCEQNLISPKIAPHGGFLCSNEHYQCDSCNQKLGQCGVCKSDTSFVKMTMSGAALLSKASETFSGSSPSINHSTDTFSSKEEEAADFSSFTRSLLEKLESIARVSKEQPNVQDSQSSVASSRIEEQRSQDQLKTVFVGHYQHPDSEMEPSYSELDKQSANETYTVNSGYTVTPRDLEEDTEDPDVHSSQTRTFRGFGPVCNIPTTSKGCSSGYSKLLTTCPQCETSEKPLSEISKPFVKIFTPEAVSPLSSSVVTVPTVSEGACGLFDDVSELTSEEELSNVFRAVCNPWQEGGAVEPPPQYEKIGCPMPIAHEVMLDATRNELSAPSAAYHLNIPRSPLTCPEESCAHLVFVSDFIKHMVIDHPDMPKKQISPRECNNFLLNPSVPSNCTNKCNILCLVRDKITDLGSSEFKDLLPVFVMSSRMSLADICGVDIQSDEGFLMIWLVGIVPEGMTLRASMTVFSSKGNVPTYHMSHSGAINSIRDSQVAKDIYKSGKMMLLSDMNLGVLTEDGRGMVKLQVIVN